MMIGDALHGSIIGAITVLALFLGVIVGAFLSDRVTGYSCAICGKWVALPWYVLRFNLAARVLCGACRLGLP